MRNLTRSIDEFLLRITCVCGQTMQMTVVRRPFTDAQYPRETFAIYEVLTCPGCGAQKERRTAIGH